MSKCDFNKVAEITLRHGYSPVSFTPTSVLAFSLDADKRKRKNEAIQIGPLSFMINN